MFSERTSVGLDVHARSVVACAIDTVTGELIRCRLTPQHADVLGWIGRLPGPAAVAYEAGPTGFGLARALAVAGIRCEVLTPSRLQRPAGERVKTDARDALHLAKLLRLDEFTAVRVPSPAEEAARDLVRAREDVRGLAHLLAQGFDLRVIRRLRHGLGPRGLLRRLIRCRSVLWFTPSSAATRETGWPDERANATASARNSAEYLQVPTWDSSPWTQDPVSRCP